MLFKTLLLCWGTLVDAQSLNLGSLVAAGESLYSSVVATNGDNVGALATAAEGALSSIQSAASSSSSTEPGVRSSSAEPISISTSSPPRTSSSVVTSSGFMSIASISSSSLSQASLSSSLSMDSVTSTASAVEGSNEASTTATPGSSGSQHRKDALLEILLPTLLSGLTLLLLLALALWFCSRQRRRRGRRASSLQRLYAAGSIVSRSPADMEERADYGLLQNGRTTTDIETEEHTAYEPDKTIPMPPQSMLRSSPRHSPPIDTHGWTVPPSRFSTSTSTNAASGRDNSTSNSGGASYNEPHMSREIRKSYQPMVSEDMPAELETGVEISNGQRASHTEKNVARAHTPPLQAAFPKLGGGPSVPRRSSKRKSGGGKVHYPSRDEAGGFIFEFPPNNHHHRAAIQSKRFSVPRKPVPQHRQIDLT